MISTLHDSLSAEYFIATDNGDRIACLQDLSTDEAIALAVDLKTYFDTYKNSDITKARPAAAALELLATFAEDQSEIQALAAWTTASLLIREGQPAAALSQLATAYAQFSALGDVQRAAETLITSVYALGVMGRYTEAIGIAHEAYQVFGNTSNSPHRASIDLNLGNIYHGNGEYTQALHYYERAAQTFAFLGDIDLQLGALNGRADALTEQGRYDEAALLHEEILCLAQQHADLGQIALSYNNLGYLYAHQGVYHRAITFFQQAFATYGSLGMRHEQMTTELEVVEVYLFLNLLDEVLYRCQSLIDYFQQHELPFEAARALALFGAAHSRLGHYSDAAAAFETSAALFAQIGSQVWAASVQLSRADLALSIGDLVDAAALAQSASNVYRSEGLHGRLAQAQWLWGEALRRWGQLEVALPLLQAAQFQAEQTLMVMLLQRCATSTGLLALEQGRVQDARLAFEHAVALAEEQRSPLPVEEFRVAYFADKLTPYQHLVRLAFAEHNVAAAFTWIERARGRALLDLVDDETAVRTSPVVDPQLVECHQTLRRSLQFRYDRLNRPTTDDLSPQTIQRLEREVLELERDLAAIDRQLRADGGSNARPLELSTIQQYLAPDTQLLVYWVDNGSVSAILVDALHTQLFPQVAAEHEVVAALQRFQFQINKFRYGTEYLELHRTHLLAATNRQLGRLYELLIAPLVPYLQNTRLILVPHGMLHYVPFAALHNGSQYLVEQFILSQLPTASTLPLCRARPERPLTRPLLVGVHDATVPSVADEIGALARRFPQGTVLLGQHAGEQALREHLATADALHLACHAVFRPTNPLFSALKLSDGWLTVRDVYSLDLRSCQLVTLSACETGVSQVAPGDELLGLARGFLSAGARALLLSHWPADDRLTAQVMERFYATLQDDVDFATALCRTQIELLHEAPHPFYWATFFAIAA